MRRLGALPPGMSLFEVIAIEGESDHRIVQAKAAPAEMTEAFRISIGQRAYPDTLSGAANDIT